MYYIILCMPALKEYMYSIFLFFFFHFIAIFSSSMRICACIRAWAITACIECLCYIRNVLALHFFSCSKCTLMVLHRVGNFSEPLAAHYFTQASLAVIYLHERGVYHRDIKPENCVLDEHFNLKLTDFGTNKVRTM